jgi:hypothetical protein
VKADIVVHWRGPASPAGTAREVGATRDDAFVCLSDSSMDGFTLAHELGHIFGLHHNDAWYNVFRENTAAYATVMAGGNAVDNFVASENKKNRFNFFSNPNVTTQLPNGQTANIGLEYVFDSVFKLNFNAPLVAQYGDNLSLPYAPVDELTTIKDVSLGDQGELWALDTAGCPWRWAWGDVRWKRAPLATGEVGTQIAVGNPTAVWCLLSDTRLKQFVNGAWIEPSSIARARQIAVGKDGYAVHLAAESDTYYDNRAYPNWQSVDSRTIGSKLTVQKRNIFWIIRASDKRIMKFDQTSNTTWTTPNTTMQANDISAGKDGTLWIVNEQGQLAISKDGGVSWNIPTQPSLPVTYPNNEFNNRKDTVKISVVDAIRGVKLTSDGKLWKKVTTEGDWVDLTWKYRIDID